MCKGADKIDIGECVGSVDSVGRVGEGSVIVFLTYMACTLRSSNACSGTEGRKTFFALTGR